MVTKPLLKLLGTEHRVSQIHEAQNGEKQAEDVVEHHPLTSDMLAGSRVRVEHDEGEQREPDDCDLKQNHCALHPIRANLASPASERTIRMDTVAARSHSSASRDALQVLDRDLLLARRSFDGQTPLRNLPTPPHPNG